MNNPLSGASRALCAVISFVLSAAAAGAELEYGVRAGVSYSDNVERTAINEEESAAGVVGIDVRGAKTTGRLLYDVYADVEYRDYFQRGIESQEFGRAIAVTSYAFVPETFDWTLSASFDQIRQDLARPIAPSNLENVVTFSTGPRFTGRFGGGFMATAEAHYTMANYSRRDLDSDTVGAVLTFGRELSERTFIGVGAAYDDVSYDVAPGLLAPDYERYEYFVRFNTRGARTTLDADVGYSQVEGKGLDEDGPLARIRFTRRVTPFVSAFIAYSREFPTSKNAAFTPLPAEGGMVEDASILTGAPRETEVSRFGLNLDHPRTRGSLVFGRQTEETLDSGTRANREFDTVFASLDRMISPRSSFGVYGRYSNEEFRAGQRGDAEETIFGARLRLVLGRALSIDFGAYRRERDSDVADGSFDELGGSLFIRYGGSRRQMDGQFGVP